MEIFQVCRIRLSLLEHVEVDVVIVRHPAHIVLRDPVEDDPVVPVHGYELRDDRVIGYRPLDIAQLELEGKVPVHRKPSGPDAHAAFFPAESEHRGSGHEIYCGNDCGNEPSRMGEDVEPQAVEAAQHRTHQMDDKHQRKEKRQIGQIDIDRMPADADYLVKLEGYVGIGDYALERQVDMQHYRNGCSQKYNSADGEIAAPVAAGKPPEQRDAADVDARYCNDDPRVEYEQCTERIEQAAVGIDRRGKQAHSALHCHPEYVECHEEECGAYERQQHITDVPVVVKEHQHSAQYQQDGHPQRNGMGNHRHHPRIFLQDLDQRPAVNADRASARIGYRIYCKTVGESQPGVDAVEGEVPLGVAQFQSADYPASPSVIDGLDQIPRGAEVHV